jgi:hypothetical protein
MRSFIPFFPALLLASPAVAQDAPPPANPVDLHAAAKALSNPVVQAGIVGVVSALSDIVMNTKIGPLADVSPKVKPDDTLGSLADRRDPGLRAHITRDTQGAVAIAGHAAGDASAMSNNLAATVAKLRAAIDSVKSSTDQAR